MASNKTQRFSNDLEKNTVNSGDLFISSVEFSATIYSPLDRNEAVSCMLSNEKCVFGFPEGTAILVLWAQSCTPYYSNRDEFVVKALIGNKICWLGFIHKRNFLESFKGCLK